MKLFLLIASVLLNLILFNCSSNTGQTSFPEVKVSGAMMNVMQKGELFGTISLDTISDKKHLYGLGPAEYLSGELLVIDGKSYKSTVTENSELNVEETYKTSAPFFVYSNVSEWNEIDLPDSVSNVKQLEKYIDLVTKNSVRPFTFKVTGSADSVHLHIVNLPKGSEVHSPEDAHKNETGFTFRNENVEIIGFFSTEHKGIFTHHDTFVHMHIITADRTKMGHLDEILFKKGTAKLYLPKD